MPFLGSHFERFEPLSSVSKVEAGGFCYRTRTFRLEEWSSDSELLVCLHGFKNNLYSFADLLPRLERPAVALDFRGHGGTSGPESPAVGSHEYLLDLHRCIEHFGISKVALLGHSLGARVATLYATLFPQRVSRLIAIDGYYRFFDTKDWPDRMRAWLAQADQPVRGLPSLNLERLERFLIRQSPKMDPAFARYLAERSFREGSDGQLLPDWNDMIQRPNPCPLEDSRIEYVLSLLTIPTLVLHGSHSFSGELDLSMPNFTVHHLNGGHQIHWEQSNAVASAIQEWWTSPR